MTNVYAIRNDGVKFQELDLEVGDLLNHIPDNLMIADVLEFHRKNTAMTSWWYTPQTEFINLTGRSVAPIPDISEWVDAALVFSPRAYRLLHELLQPYGEFLPVKANGEIYYLFNCFTMGEADEEKCEFEYHEGIRLGIKHLVFKDSVAEALIFKTPMDACLTLYCNDRLKDIIQSYEFTGVVFDKELIRFT